MSDCGTVCLKINETTRKQEQDLNFFIQNPLVALELAFPLILITVLLIVVIFILIICKKTKKVRFVETSR
jgi:hypothetical protein